MRQVAGCARVNRSGTAAHQPTSGANRATPITSQPSATERPPTRPSCRRVAAINTKNASTHGELAQAVPEQAQPPGPQRRR